MLKEYRLIKKWEMFKPSPEFHLNLVSRLKERLKNWAGGRSPDRESDTTKRSSTEKSMRCGRGPGRECRDS